MKWPIYLLAVVLTAAQAFSQTVSESQRRGRETVDAALAALGGPKFLAMEDRTEIGRVYSFYRERLSGLAKAIVYTRYLSPSTSLGPGAVRVRERTSYGASAGDRKKEDYATLFDETQGFQITFKGARPIPPEALERYRDSLARNIFYILRYRLNEPGMIVEFAESMVFENQPVDRVVFTDNENRSVEVMFGRTSHLPAAQIFYRRDPKTLDRSREVTRFDKYHDAGNGVMWPLVTARERDGARIFQMFSDKVEVNKGLNDSLFTLPTGIDVLPASP